MFNVSFVKDKLREIVAVMKILSEDITELRKEVQSLKKSLEKGAK